MTLPAFYAFLFILLSFSSRLFSNFPYDSSLASEISISWLFNFQITWEGIADEYLPVVLMLVLVREWILGLSPPASGLPYTLWRLFILQVTQLEASHSCCSAACNFPVTGL